MRESFVVLATLAVGLGACASDAPSTIPLGEGPALAFESVWVLDPEAGRSGPSTVVIQGERVVAVVADGARLAERVERVDAEGRFLLPGLWDLHTHLSHADVQAPPLLVTQGVTGVRDLGAKLEEIEALRGRIASGELLGPRVVRSGPTLNGAKHGSHHRVIESADDARQAVEELAASGVDLLKTHNATGREAYFALLEAAGEAGLPVVGHVPTAVDPAEACAAGQASVEHVATLFEGTYLTRFEGELQAFLAMPDWLESDAPELVRCFAERQTLFVPTLRAYELRARLAAAWDEPDPRWRYVSVESYRKWRESAEPSEMDRSERVIELRHSLVDTGLTFVGLLHEAGAPIGAGTDLASTGLLPGFDLHAEIRLLARAGLTPREALRASTRGPGASATGEPLTGRVTAGAPADLILLESDAFEDLSALDSIQGVVLRGRYLDREELDAALASLENELP